MKEAVLVEVEGEILPAFLIYYNVETHVGVVADAAGSMFAVEPIPGRKGRWSEIEHGRPGGLAQRLEITLVDLAGITLGEETQ